MAYIDWWNRTGPVTLGERFGLNEGGRINMKPGGIVEPGVTHYARTEAEIKADAFRTGVPRKKISDWTSQQRVNLKTWMKNTGSSLEDFNKKKPFERFNIKRGHSLGFIQAQEPEKLANIKKWEKITGKKFEDIKDNDKKWRVRSGVTTGLGESKFTEAERAANVKAWEKNTGLKFKDIKEPDKRSSIQTGKTKGSMASRALKDSLERSIWLKDYTPDNLLKDLKSGKTKNQIAEELYTNNPEYFDDLQKTRPVHQSVLNNIKTAVGGRIGKKQDLRSLNELNEKNLLAREKIALKDVRNFIEKNQDAYKKVYASNKIGAVSNFKEKVLDFMSKKYPEFIKRSKGGQNILSGQRVFTPYRLTERSGQGQYSLDVGLKKDIRNVLGIPERPLAGEGMTISRLQRSYNKNLLSLIKIARDKNIIPKSVNSESKYFSYLKKTQIDPIRNLFGRKFNFGQEHLGGVSRAVVVNDANSLAKITAIDPVVNRWVKGTQYDTRISSLMKLAKQSSGETAKGYLDSVNKLIAESDKKFGLNQTKYKIVKDKIIPIQAKASLEDSLYKKAQRALKTFVATKRFKDPNFKLLPEALKKAINFLKGGDIPQSNQFLKAAIKQEGGGKLFSKAFGPLLWGVIGDISLEEMAHGKPSGEALLDVAFLGSSWRKGKKRLISSKEENLAYDRTQTLNLYENAKEGSSGMRSNLMSMVTGAAQNDPDFKGQPGGYIEWLKFKVREPDQMALAVERERKTEKALEVTDEQKAAAEHRYKAWSNIPLVSEIKSLVDESPKDDWI